MKIALIGSTGKIGSRILNEALARGHQVTAIVRDATRMSNQKPNVEYKISFHSVLSIVERALSQR